jgi:uncharacterized protein YdeI (YjbR/CyaY-like superfamily)
MNEPHTQATRSDVDAALSAHPAAAAAFARLAASHRREYLNWIAEAKKPATRARRIDQMIERLQRPQ